MRTLSSALLFAVAFGMNAVTLEAQPYAGPEAGGSTVPVESALTECAGCEEFESYHNFDHTGHDCQSLFCEDDWFQCDTECHTSYYSGSCESHHTECFFDQQDGDALELALRTDDTPNVRRILTPLASEGRLTFLADREILIVTGCKGDVAAVFPLLTAGIKTRASVIELVTE